MMFARNVRVILVTSFLLPLLTMMTCNAAIAAETQKRPVFTQDIKFVSSEAGEVVLVWGVNGWKTVASAQRPSGTVIKKSVMHTPMTRLQENFVATLQVTEGTVIDFGFLIMRTQDGLDVNIWEADGKDPFHEKARPDHAITVFSKADVLQAGKTPREKWNAYWEVMIVILCVIVPVWSAMSFVKSRHKSWRRRILLPSFKKPLPPTRVGDAFILCSSVLIGLTSAELILHAMDPYGSLGAAEEIEWVRKGGPEIEKAFRIDASLGLRPRLNYGPYSEYGTVINTYAFNRPSEVRRILVLGSKAVFQGRLVEALRRLHSPNEVEVWNGGVPSFGTIQSINFYRQYQSKIRPNRVILFINSSDVETTPIAYRDGRNNIVAFAPYLANSPVTSWLFTNSHLYRLTAGLLVRMYGKEESVLQEMGATLADFATELKRERIEFLVVLVPLLVPESTWTTDEKDRRAATLNKLQNVGVAYVDLLPPVRAAISDNLDLLQHAGNPFEPSEALAERLGAYLQEHGFANGKLRADHHAHQ